jgi:peptide/nickel transport system permease protein
VGGAQIIPDVPSTGELIRFRVTPSVMALLRRLAEMAVLLVLLSAGLFYLLGLMPESKDETLLSLNPRLAAEDVAHIRALRGLDRPVHERYSCWLFGQRLGATCEDWPSERGVLGGDLGYSTVHALPVAEVLGMRLFATLSITGPAFVLALALAVTLGILSATHRRRALDRAVGAASALSLALPLHWVAMLAVLIAAVELHLLPAGGIDTPGNEGFISRVEHAVLPVLVLAWFYAARWTRYLRASMLEVIHLDFIRSLRARGLSERDIMWRHAFPNAALPLITVVTQSLPGLFSGALVIERVFAYPGIGVLIWESVEGNDYLTAVVLFLIYAFLTMLASLLLDVSLFFADPRIRAGAPLDRANLARAEPGGPS